MNLFNSCKMNSNFLLSNDTEYSSAYIFSAELYPQCSATKLIDGFLHEVRKLSGTRNLLMLSQIINSIFKDIFLNIT